jgi:hypothetical protein
MKLQLKQLGEQIAGHRIWISRSASKLKIESLIKSLHPRGTVSPLMRIGPAGDGGYLLPDDLDGISACISPGVSFETGFDTAVAERGIDVYMADASVEGPPSPNPRFHFMKKFLDVFEDDSHTRLDTLCGSASAKGDLLLQMDIEGAEWRVLLDASPEVLNRFRIMVIEFHDLKEMFGRFSYGMIEATFNKILSTHSVVHIHPNNISPMAHFFDIPIPPLVEITFYRNDRMFNAERPSRFPHPLDSDNVPNLPSIVLPECWWRAEVRK